MNKLKKPLVIVANGNFPYHPIPIDRLKKASSIIACDGAADILIENGYMPNIIIGDLDSISRENEIKYKKIIIQVKNQSENDLRKAIKFSKKQGIGPISIISATGKREDHTIGNIFSIMDYDDIEVLTDTGSFRCIKNNEKIDSFKGQKISLFTIDKTIKISSKSLKYNFNNESISSIFYGTLNESIEEIISFKLSHGKLLIFQSHH